MRAFLSVEPGKKTRSYLASILPSLERDWLRPVREEQLHLTLSFFHDLDDSLVETMSKTLSGLKGFESALSGMGSFPSWKLPRTIWLGLSANSSWIALHHEISQRLQSIGVPGKNTGGFVPHITLARVKSTPVPRELTEVRNIKILPLPFPAKEIVLKQSKLESRGAVHTTLWRLPLAKDI